MESCRKETTRGYPYRRFDRTCQDNLQSFKDRRYRQGSNMCSVCSGKDPDAGEEELAQQLKRVRAEKLAVAPGCATCVAKCGNTDDYDMERLWNGPDQVRSLKIRLFSGLKKTGRVLLKLLKTEKGKDKHFQSIMESIYKDFLSWQRTGTGRDTAGYC